MLKTTVLVVENINKIGGRDGNIRISWLYKEKHHCFHLLYSPQLSLANPDLLFIRTGSLAYSIF